jgi:hypothetical protein
MLSDLEYVESHRQIGFARRFTEFARGFGWLAPLVAFSDESDESGKLALLCTFTCLKVGRSVDASIAAKGDEK